MLLTGYLTKVNTRRLQGEGQHLMVTVSLKTLTELPQTNTTTMTESFPGVKCQILLQKGISFGHEFKSNMGQEIHQ